MGKQLVFGILAHVDAGKTTLSEGILYQAGVIRSLGRVDDQNTLLDSDELERKRGITIFSSQARFSMGGLELTLLDTPGHVDFSAEMERTLQVLDYAVLLISGPDGVQGHTLTLWKLLQKYRIPVFLFINKMDQPGTDEEQILSSLQKRLDEACIRLPQALFAQKESGGEDAALEAFYDQAAMCSEELMEAYLERGALDENRLAEAIRKRQLFPCCFGSALRMTGVNEFLQAFVRLVRPPEYGSAFGARVFKIARDSQGSRLTYLKITGGTLRVRDTLQLPEDPGVSPAAEEKVSQLRLYSGDRFQTVSEASAGMICVALGLSQTKAGQGLGVEKGRILPLLVPVLNYQIRLPEGTDAGAFLPKLYQLEEEEPQLHVRWNEALSAIQIQVMGEVQTEILRHLIRERFGVEVSFDTGTVLYKETIAAPVVGSGHYEPLRHYAEVHLLLEPGAEGSGLVFEARCPKEQLAGNWQRLVLTHLAEREHRGVLTGSPLTDLKITLIGGRAHLKHTEGGDFRQATYRAVRQGLMEAESVLLEPWYDFRLELPRECLGRAMTDLEQMAALFGLEESEKAEESGLCVLSGRVAVAALGEYHRQVLSYTKGLGQLTCSFHGYLPCHDPEEVIKEAGYDPLTDAEQPAGSVFCAHGAGYYVPWDQVKAHCHTELPAEFAKVGGTVLKPPGAGPYPSSAREEPDLFLAPEEIDKILEQAGGSNQKKHIDRGKRWGQRYSGGKGYSETAGSPAEEKYGRQGSGTAQKPQPGKEKYLLVDGYNIIFAWEELRELAKDHIDGARGRLMDMLCNYQAFVRCQVLLVFDAYRVKGHQTEVVDYHHLKVIYTKEAETADQYIEKFAHDNSRKYDVTVATSDGLEQIIIRSQGSRLLSATDLWEELCRVNSQIRDNYLK